MVLTSQGRLMDWLRTYARTYVGRDSGSVATGSAAFGPLAANCSLASDN